MQNQNKKSWGSGFITRKFIAAQICQTDQNPSSDSILSFFADGTDRLYWWHEGDADFCERRGEYSIELPLLVDKIVWVNPKNTFQCSRDPDMQLGKIARTPTSFSGGDFLLHLPLGDETLTYVWQKIIPTARTQE